MTKTLRAYHGRTRLKQSTLTQMRQHREADQLVQGQYWSENKGCAVACLTHDPNGNHALYETKWGIPRMLAHLEDRIFEGLAPKDAQRWPELFLSAIPVGADLSRVGPQFLVAVVQRRLDALDEAGRNLVGPAIEQVLAVLRQWATTGTLDADQIAAAESAAWSAAWSAASAASAAWSAAWSAESAASAARSAESAASAAWSAESAAEGAAWSAARSAASAASAARSAASAARSAASAAWSAASAASAARSAASAAWSAESAEYRWMAATLCRLLRRAK